MTAVETFGDGTRCGDEVWREDAEAGKLDVADGDHRNDGDAAITVIVLIVMLARLMMLADPMKVTVKVSSVRS